MGKPFTLTTGPFVGMCDILNLSAQDATRAAYLENMYGPQIIIGGDLISRVGYTRVGFATTARTGTITSTAITLGTPVTIPGVSTLFQTELAVGDYITAGGQSGFIQTIASNTSLGLYPTTTGTMSGAYTYNPASIVGGPIYGIWQHTRTDGTYHRLLLVGTSVMPNAAVVGAYAFSGSTGPLRLVEYDPSNAVHPFTNRTTLSMSNVAIDTTTRVYGIKNPSGNSTFANYFIFHDQANRPRKVDFSSPSAPVLSNLSDANYTFYGPPVIYYGKLFFLDASDQETLRWSEENDPDTGYGTGANDNSWTLAQTSSDQIQTVVGTNSALYVFRNNSCTTITGAANSDFASAGVSEDVSTTIGTRSPDAAIAVNQTVFFLDQYGRPGRVEPGYGYIPLYDRCIETIRGIPTTVAQLRNVWARHDGALNLVKVGYPAGSASTRDEQMLTFDSRSWECMGLHKIPDGSGSTIGHDFGAPWLDQNIFPRFTVASAQTGDLGVYIEQMETTPQASSQDTTLAGTTLTVAGTVTPPKMGGDALTEKRFNRVSIGQRNIGGTNGLAQLNVTERGPYTSSWSAPKAVKAPGGSYDQASVKAEYGIDITGRWAQVQITNDTTGNPQTRFTVDTVTMTGNLVDDHPAAR